MGNEAQPTPQAPVIPDASRPSEIEVRAIREDETVAWDRALARGFLRPHVAEAAELRLRQFHNSRLLGAFDAAEPARCVATFRSFDGEVTVPDGAAIAVDAITGVTVSSTHRRRGLLSRMMRQDLAAARERGSVAAVLIAAEYNIYGRFGFGPATRRHGWTVDVARAGGLRADLPLPTGGRVDFVTMAELRKLGPELHDRWRVGQPGALTRTELHWELKTGETSMPGWEWKEPFAALHRDASGAVTGLIVYRVDDQWDGMYPNCNLTVEDFLALDRPTAHALWRLAFSVDWVRRIVVPNIGIDDPLPLLVNDPRAATPYEEDGDFMWLRLLDVPAAFATRSYRAPGRLVVAVDDPDGYAAGRWALETAADGTGRCLPTEDEPELSLTAGTLSRLYLGAESATGLAEASLLTELRPGAAATADLLLRTERRAWNPDGF